VTWVAVAIGGSALVGAGASYLGSKKQAKGAEKAADLSMEQFHLLNQQQQPFMQGGYGAMGKLNTLLGLNPRPQPQTQGMPLLPAGFLSNFPGHVFGNQSVPANPVPTPRPDAQPIKFGRPGGTSLNRLLALRAAQGDQQAQWTLRGGV
jgi:hypothetical protein